MQEFPQKVSAAMAIHAVGRRTKVMCAGRLTSFDSIFALKFPAQQLLLSQET
jgi:hypothetical protein